MKRMSSQRQRSQAGYWTDVAQQLSEIASSVNYRTEAQLRHRMALVEGEMEGDSESQAQGDVA